MPEAPNQSNANKKAKDKALFGGIGCLVIGIIVIIFIIVIAAM